MIFKDNLSGMNLTSMSNSAFYHISAVPLSRSVRPPRLILPTRILFAYTGLPSDPVVVRVVFNNGHPMRGGNYEVVVDSGTGGRGIQDIAGNALDGNYYGRFPTGDGLPGGDFVATIATFHNRVLAGIPVKDGYVPPVAGVDSQMGWSSMKIRRLEHPTYTVAEREHGIGRHARFLVKGYGLRSNKALMSDGFLPVAASRPEIPLQWTRAFDESRTV